jgi:hypothetical protein
MVSGLFHTMGSEQKRPSTALSEIFLEINGGPARVNLSKPDVGFWALKKDMWRIADDWHRAILRLDEKNKK